MHCLQSAKTWPNTPNQRTRTNVDFDTAGVLLTKFTIFIAFWSPDGVTEDIALLRRLRSHFRASRVALEEAEYSWWHPIEAFRTDHTDIRVTRWVAILWCLHNALSSTLFNNEVDWILQIYFHGFPAGQVSEDVRVSGVVCADGIAILGNGHGERRQILNEVDHFAQVVDLRINIPKNKIMPASIKLDATQKTCVE